ncbi:uncharacterized protein LACBIDRAFT_326618 [Laccaria bicolor S238N-H82]|uniref:Predicted protein n=1 Tax=Laccaria bicolor (strain S238N-H82 / ATCC MYA-4686) TaxID=486041 RepID=B0D987_LACBS|nr:uncharacterized protein LACBIDRAFT_326618 [Laccaria bicolor S238N-H82]EDR09208.1 predicted protein [Laccaria bicolor S238N-H82]|eukprot:XP_001880521.1 predicted protein [Laccaria bicolor S238N-H82]
MTTTQQPTTTTTPSMTTTKSTSTTTTTPGEVEATKTDDHVATSTDDYAHGQRHVPNGTTTSPDTEGRGCHVAISDVATKRRTTTSSSFVVIQRLVAPPSSIPTHPVNDHHDTTTMRAHNEECPSHPVDDHRHPTTMTRRQRAPTNDNRRPRKTVHAPTTICSPPSNHDAGHRQRTPPTDEPHHTPNNA